MVAALATLLLVPVAAQAKFQLGLEDQTLRGIHTDDFAAPGYAALRQIGGSMARVNVTWAAIARSTTPFDLSNQNDPHYFWTQLDAADRRAAAHHDQILLYQQDAPTWAEGPGAPVNDPNVGPGAWEPNPVLFGQLMHALATRYSGNTPDPLNPGLTLPRIKYYEIWNEQNLGAYLAGPNTPGQYRAMLAAGYSAVKAVHSDNTVVFGGVAPVATTTAPYHYHPLTFLRQVLCVRQRGRHYVRTAGCGQKVRFDALGIHPYTLAATPTKPAYNPNDLLVHDVGKVHPVIAAAERLHTINGGSHPLWNTEWSWFTNPPQPQYGDAPNVAARYVAYSMYEMWKAGVQVIIWQVLADVIGGPNPGGGLETTAGVAKPSMSAFAFPFIASVKGRSGYAWGRAPLRRRVKVFVQHEVKGRWRRVATAHSDGYGIFQAHFRARGNGTYRAQVAENGQLSLPYFSAKIPPRRTHAYNFG